MQTDLKKAGESFGKFAKNLASNDSKISRLQAIARDVLAENQETLEPILSIISRPDFRCILDLAGTGKGVIQKHTFIAEIRKIYTSQVLAQLSLFIDGILALDTKDQEEYLSDCDLEECSDPLGVC